jgi:predicted transcriptional regulator
MCCTATHAVVYACKPIGRVIGEFAVEGTVTLSPDDLWRATAHAAGIPESGFFAYFAGRDVGHALKVGDPNRFGKPLDLWEDFGLHRPPQSFQYLGKR